MEDDHDNKDDSNCDEAPKNEYEDFNYEIKNDICNRENQWYGFLNILIWFLKIILNKTYHIVTCLQAVSKKVLNP